MRSVVRGSRAGGGEGGPARTIEVRLGGCTGEGWGPLIGAGATCMAACCASSCCKKAKLAERHVGDFPK